MRSWCFWMIFDRIEAAGREVPDVEIHPVQFGHREPRLEARRAWRIDSGLTRWSGRAGARIKPVFLKERHRSFCHDQCCRYGHDLRAERMCHLDAANDFGIIALLIETKVEGEDTDARRFQLLSMGFDVVESGTQPPGTHAFAIGLCGGRRPQVRRLQRSVPTARIP